MDDDVGQPIIAGFDRTLHELTCGVLQRGVSKAHS